MRCRFDPFALLKWGNISAVVVQSVGGNRPAVVLPSFDYVDLVAAAWAVLMLVDGPIFGYC